MRTSSCVNWLKSVQSFISHRLMKGEKFFNINDKHDQALKVEMTITTRSRVEEEFWERTAWMNCISLLSCCKCSHKKNRKILRATINLKPEPRVRVRARKKLYQESKRMRRVSEIFNPNIYQCFQRHFSLPHIARLLTKKGCVVYSCGRWIKKKTRWQSEEEIIHLVINSNWKAGKDGAEY